MKKTFHQTSVNGRTYNMLGIPGANVFKLEVISSLGSHRERFETSKRLYGISHLVEHLGFRQTKDYSTEQLQELIKTYGNHNASTCHDQINYWFMTDTPHHELAIKAVCNYAFNDLHQLSQKEFEIEKNVVMNEIKRYADDDQTMFHFMSMPALYGYEPEDNILGTVDTVGEITLADVVDFKNKHLIDTHPRINIVYDPMVIDRTDIISKTEQEIGRFIPEHITPVAPIVTTILRGNLMVPNPSEQSMLSCILTHDSHSFSVGRALSHLSYYATGTSLSDVIREKHGLTYGITCERSDHNKVSTICIGGDVSSGNEQKFIDLMHLSIDNTVDAFDEKAHANLREISELHDTLNMNLLKDTRWFSIVKHDQEFFDVHLKHMAEVDLEEARQRHSAARYGYEDVRNALLEIKTTTNNFNYTILSNVVF